MSIKLEGNTGMTGATYLKLKAYDENNDSVLKGKESITAAKDLSRELSVKASVKNNCVDLLYRIPVTKSFENSQEAEMYLREKLSIKEVDPISIESKIKEIINKSSEK